MICTDTPFKRERILFYLARQRHAALYTVKLATRPAATAAADREYIIVIIVFVVWVQSFEQRQH